MRRNLLLERTAEQKKLSNLKFNHFIQWIFSGLNFVQNGFDFIYHIQNWKEFDNFTWDFHLVWVGFVKEESLTIIFNGIK
jgi:hypothetical protein